MTERKASAEYAIKVLNEQIDRNNKNLQQLESEPRMFFKDNKILPGRGTVMTVTPNK